MTNEDLDVKFIGTNKKSDGTRQLIYTVNDETFFVEADTKNFLAGERLVQFASKAVDLYNNAKHQGIIKA